MPIYGNGIEDVAQISVGFSVPVVLWMWAAVNFVSFGERGV